MPEYIIAYRGKQQKPASPEEGAKSMAKWQAWIGDLGAAAINPGTPLGKSWLVSSDGVSDDAGPHALTGYTIVAADDIEAALEIAKDCPYLEMGSVEVAQIMKMQ